VLACVEFETPKFAFAPGAILALATGLPFASSMTLPLTIIAFAVAFAIDGFAVFVLLVSSQSNNPSVFTRTRARRTIFVITPALADTSSLFVEQHTPSAKKHTPFDVCFLSQ